MQKYFDNVTNRSGGALPNATVTVTLTSSGALATIYSDNGVTTKTNPIQCDTNGYYEFYAADGRYTLTFSGHGVSVSSIADVVIDDAPVALATAVASIESELLDVDSALANVFSVSVDDLVYPVTVPHRGAGSMQYPEGPIQAFQAGYEQGWQCIDGGDFRLQKDGSFLNAHNPNLSAQLGYNQSGYGLTATEAKQIPLAISGYYLPAPAGNFTLCTAKDMLRQLGGKVVMTHEIKVDGAGAFANPNASGASGTAFAALVASMKQTRSMIVSSFDAAELTACTAAGIETMIIRTGDQSGAPEIAANQLIRNAGVKHIGFDLATNTTAVIATYKAMGFRVWAYTAFNQYDQNLWISAGADGIFSDAPLYTLGDVSKYRRTTDNFISGVFPPGMIAADAGTLNRGTLANGRWSPKPGKAVSLLGQFCPVASPSAFTWAFTVCFDALGSDTSRHPDLVVATDDQWFDAAVPRSIHSGYIFFVRVTGQMQIFRSVTGTNVSIGSASSTALVAPLTLTAALTSGAAITSLSVSALPVGGVPSGTQFMLPTGQLATTSGAALAGATSVTIASLTPSAAVANGTSLPQAVRMTLQVTATQLILTRLDTSTVLTVTDSTFRGSYLHAGQNDSAGTSGLQCSFAAITIS